MHACSFPGNNTAQYEGFKHNIAVKTHCHLLNLKKNIYSLKFVYRSIPFNVFCLLFLQLHCAVAVPPEISGEATVSVSSSCLNATPFMF